MVYVEFYLIRKVQDFRVLVSTKMSIIRPFLLGVLAFSDTASAQVFASLFESNGSMTLGSDVVRMSGDSWSSTFASGYNATSKASIQSYNITAEYPGSELPSHQSWNYTVKVKPSIGPLAFPGNDTLSNAAGTWLQVKHPKSDRVKVPSTDRFAWQVPKHPSWSMCGVVFVSSGWTRDTPLLGPGCTSMLSADCIADIKRNLTEAYKEQEFMGPNGAGGESLCPPPRPVLIPERCRPPSGIVGLGVGLTQELPVIPPDAELMPSDSPLGGNSNGTIDLLAFAHIGNGTVDAFQQAVRQVYVVGHIWGLNGEYAEENAITGASEGPWAEVTCLKAEVIDGGVADEPVQDGSGNGDDDRGEGQNGNGNGEEVLGNPYINAAIGLGVSTRDLCKLPLVVMAASFFSL
ncbi:hypothetical protein QC761_608620 [Podospora bellae-mahoneyi]|uniref:Uncharacterized protein n=1 Tax=Podospora bellae-mahoneyi TaxID=2093777 RepID=A0ABR0FCJ0_9PEZI|nr:hypothetical protein QC761_608620 [Podospora bellae-mahoneyi]